MKLIREFDDFDWADSSNLNGVKIKTPMGGELDIIDNGGDYVTVTWDKGKRSTEYYRKSVEAMIKKGTWTLTESFDDFDWIRDTTPSFDENNTPSVGDVLVCLPGYYNSPSSPYHSEEEDPNCAGAGYAEGRIIVVKEVDVWPEGPEGKRIVVWPDEDESEMYWDYDDGEVCFECGIYGFALTYYTETLNESEEDDFDWIRDIQPTIFKDAVIGQTYDITTTPLLLDAIRECGDNEEIYLLKRTTVIDKDNLPYGDIFCVHEREDIVPALLLEFLDEEGLDITRFWVTEDMVQLH